MSENRYGERGRNGNRETAGPAQLPLLDRLIDDAPDRLRDPPLSANETFAVLRRSIRRDLEALLNARRRWRSWPQAYEELAVSPVGYGIADFTAGAFNDPRRRDELRLEVEQAILRFEPRLDNVRVFLIDAKNPLEATLHLRIEAMLRVEPAPEPIAFDTLVDAATAEVRVRAGATERAREAADV
jgi:type VI secretion system protein ImpF